MQPTMTTDEYGTIRYTLYGRLHRLDGPAVIWPDGTQCWCLHGQRCREDGPAVFPADGDEEWFINDKRYTFNNYCKKLNLSEEDITFLKLKFNTCIVV